MLRHCTTSGGGATFVGVMVFRNESEQRESDDASDEIVQQVNNVMNANGHAAVAFAMGRGFIQPQAMDGSYYGHLDAARSLLYSPPTQRIDDILTNNGISSRIGDNLLEGLIPYSNSIAMMARHPIQHSHNDLDQILSQHGLGYPRFEPSPTTHGLNPNSNSNISQLPGATVQFTTQSSLHADSFAAQGPVNNNFNRGQMAGTDDWMKMQHLSSSNNLFTYASDEWTREFERNNTSSQVSYADHSSTPSQETSSSTSLSQPPTSLAVASGPSSNNGNIHHVCSLAVPSDSVFLDPAHIFLRSRCIELFITAEDDMANPGRGARALHVGQVGLRCAWCKNLARTQLLAQAICYPSKLATIFESVRNYQRKHIEVCPGLPHELKEKFKGWIHSNVPNNKSQRILRAYYAEAASDLGLVDTPRGLIFGSQQTSGIPSENLLAIMAAADSPPTTSSDLFKKYKGSSSKDKSLVLGKFEHLASERTREVIRNARKDGSALVFSHDFPRVGDVEFLLLNQFVPFKASADILNRLLARRRKIRHEEFYAHPGLCCKFCARVHGTESYHSGLFFPTNRAMFTEFAFTQSLRDHILECFLVPQELKDALEELKRLASEHGVVAKRGSKKKFLEKIWERMGKLRW